MLLCAWNPTRHPACSPPAVVVTTSMGWSTSPMNESKLIARGLRLAGCSGRRWRRGVGPFAAALDVVATGGVHLLRATYALTVVHRLTRVHPLVALEPLVRSRWALRVPCEL